MDVHHGPGDHRDFLVFGFLVSIRIKKHPLSPVDGADDADFGGGGVLAPDPFDDNGIPKEGLP